jgi:hypothetical protein
MPVFRRIGAPFGQPHTLNRMTPTRDGENTAYAIKITREAQVRLCEAAGINPPEWEDRAWPEHEMRAQTLSLTERDFDEILSGNDIVSRQPYKCTSCGEQFTIDEFNRIQRWADANHTDNPIEANAAIHESCGGYSTEVPASPSDFQHFFRNPS